MPKKADSSFAGVLALLIIKSGKKGPTEISISAPLHLMFPHKGGVF